MRKVAFAGVVAVCLLVAVGYAAVAALRDEPEARSERASPAARAAVARLGRGAPQVVFQHVARDDAYARIAIAAAAEPGARTIAGRVCERVYFGGGRGLCLLHVTALTPRYEVMTLDRNLKVRAHIELPGIVSRARVSQDGRYGAATSFVTGHSYRDKGFSTHTVLIDMVAGSAIADLETFTVTREGRTIDSPDFNFWGVTFAPGGDRFYATLSTRGKIYLVRGSVSARRMDVVHQGVECPSLSPNATRLAFKKRHSDGWRLSVLDLKTMRETPLAETRSVDDQAEWLDDGHVLYGLAGDVWRVRADGRGRPERYLEDALSPAVVPARASA